MREEEALTRRGGGDEPGERGATCAAPPVAPCPETDAVPFGRATAAPDVARESDVQGLLERFPPYRVILHNDDHHGMDEVVLALRKSVPGLNERKAILIMLGAHLHGRATVIVCPREQAEYYAERLGSYGLTVTIERAE